MANPKVKFKRSSVSGKRPSLSNLETGEVALNTYDGKLFTVQDTGGIGIGTTVTLVNPWQESYGGGTITYSGNVNVSGVVTATSVVKSGGTSSQFLKADGSVDSSTFLDTSSTTQTKTGGLNVHGDVYIVNYSSYSSSASLYIPVSSSTKGAITTKTTVTDTRAHIRFENSNGVVGGIITNGSATSYLTSSDYRLKENITGIADGISRVKQLRPVRFNFISNQSDTANDPLPNEVQTTVSEYPTLDGFLAHEAQEVVPECVSGQKDGIDENGNPIYQGIDQSKLVPLLTAALQEAIAKIEELESRLNAAGL